MELLPSYNKNIACFSSILHYRFRLGKSDEGWKTSGAVQQWLERFLVCYQQNQAKFFPMIHLPIEDHYLDVVDGQDSLILLYLLLCECQKQSIDLQWDIASEFSEPIEVWKATIHQWVEQAKRH